MLTTNDHYIAGWKKASDWASLRAQLISNTPGAWKKAFTDFYETRLHLRYIHPINILQTHGTFRGEGFSILAIQCSLIEFLESTEQGKNYRYTSEANDLGEYEYSSSKDIFVSFLRKRAPFAATFNKASANAFYVDIRCGLLHEARTKNGWRIWAKGSPNLVANIKQRIVYRDNFQAALLTYIKDYGERLQHDAMLQQAFIRKFDYLCH